MDPLVLFFKQQLERISKKPVAHAPGPRKPNLAQLDLGLKPAPKKKHAKT